MTQFFGTATGRIQVDDQFLDDFSRFGPPAKNLSRLVRPAFVAEPGKTYVWGDWSAIEARTLPWLAASRSAEKVLDVFRASDADKKLADIYCREAHNISGLPAQDIYDGAKAKDAEMTRLRQTGKVTVLSLGFGGATGALQRMAVAYGIYLDDATAARIVEVWRANNAWARSLWDALWEAVMSALQTRDTIFPVGRVAYVYDRNYLGGSLFCALPCGRLLTYPTIRWEQRDEDVRPGVVETRTHLTCRKGYGRKKLWYGTFAENITQAGAASILRAALDTLDPYECVVGHTHDEIVNEVAEADAEENEALLTRTMLDTSGWREGLPLAVETEINWYYTKAKVLK
jgi:DNA polymerase